MNHNTPFKKTAGNILLSGLIFAVYGCATHSIQNQSTEPHIVLQTQGSFAVGGTTVKHSGTFSEQNFLSPDGQTAYGDHAYVFYQIPVNTHKYPLVFQHGGAQTKRTWESTPDGRDGFQNIFLKKSYSVYLVDQPRMGEAGLSTKDDTGKNPWAGNPMYADKTFFLLSRVGNELGVFKNSQFPDNPASIEAFQRSWNPYSGELDNDLNAKSLAQLFEKIGQGILITHSMGGTIGWRTPFYTDNVKAIVAYEPGGTPFIFPENEMPAPVKTTFAPLSASAMGVPMNEFLKLTRIPIVIYYGDFIAEKPDTAVGPDKWRSEYEMAKQFVMTVNRHGGDATLVHLPDIGIKGNSHFLMAEKNNQEIAGILASWLQDKGLDK
ncbi:TPA: alpha/beta fold hydrolase [Escherichia coli]|nr:alpha/beta fold hydrolase [Escherichia coli]